MEAIILIFLRLMVPLGILGGLAWFAFGPGSKRLQRLLAPEPPYLREARAIAGRIARNLRSADAALAARCMSEIDALLDQRLPAILEQYERLTQHLAETSIRTLEAEIERLQAQIRDSDDEALKAILAENLGLARGRLETREKMKRLSGRTEAQLKQVLLYLEALETRSVSLQLTAPQGETPDEMGRILEEVALIEQMYRDMDAAPQQTVSAPDLPAEEAGEHEREGREPRERRRDRSGGR